MRCIRTWLIVIASLTVAAGPSVHAQEPWFRLLGWMDEPEWQQPGARDTTGSITWKSTGERTPSPVALDANSDRCADENDGCGEFQSIHCSPGRNDCSDEHQVAADRDSRC